MTEHEVTEDRLARLRRITAADVTPADALAFADTVREQHPGGDAELAALRSLADVVRVRLPAPSPAPWAYTVTWHPIEGTGYPDQHASVAWPFHAQVGPADDAAGTWSWTLLRANRDGTETELTGSGRSAPAASEELAKMLAEAAGRGALAQYETAEQEQRP